MPFILFHTEKVRDALKAPKSILADLLFLAFAGSAVGMLVLMAKHASAPFSEKIDISLSLWMLPKYTLMSLARGFAAYVLSLVFTLIYATVAAHNHRAEKLMIPALDVLQSIPVLSFLPTVVLAMIALFPTRELGLEIACVVMIFTGQAWNMTFSMYGSIRSIPAPLREAAQVYRLSSWRVFRMLELPASMIGLVWNSMMSMAGGWFVLTLSEAFTLQNRDFRLPGIGSYMGEAIDKFDKSVPQTYIPIIGAVVAMVLMIVAVDQFFWRPIVAWSERFKMEETAETDKPQSWVLELLADSRIYHWVHHWWQSREAEIKAVVTARRKTSPAYAGAAVSGSSSIEIGAEKSARNGGGGRYAATVEDATEDAAAESDAGHAISIPPPPQRNLAWLKTAFLWLFLAALFVGSAIGLWSLVKLLVALPLRDPAAGQDWIHVIEAIGASFLRTTAAILIGALWTLPVGIMIGLSPKWSQRLQPVVQVVASFPANMIFPLMTLFIVRIGFPFTVGCVALMLLGTQWYILFNVIAGAMAIPGDLKEVQYVFGTDWARRWTRLYIPCVFPYLVTGLVTAAGGAWNATIVSEYVQIGQNTFIGFGIGSIISQATNAGNYPLLAAATVTLACTVVLLNRSFWKKLYRVAEDRYSLNV